MRPAGGGHDAVGQQPRDAHGLQRTDRRELLGGHEILGGDEAPVRRAEEELVEEGIGPEDLPRSRRVRSVHVHDRGVEAERGHRHELLAVVVRRGDGAKPGVDAEDVGAEPRPGRQERDALGRREQAEVEHALVDLHRIDRAGLARDPEVWVGRDRVEGHEAEDSLRDLAGCAEQADVGTAVGDDGQVAEVGAEDRPDCRHRLATRPPAPDPHRHAALELAHELVEGQPLVGHVRPSAT